MKKLSLFILLLALVLCAVLFTACDTSTECPDGHTPVTDAAVAPTCTESGLTEGSHCSVCSAVITAQEKLPATGHTKSDWINDETVKLSCTEDGARYKECKNCHTVLEVGKIAHTGHDFGNWSQTKAANCTETGLKERECTICGEKESAVIEITHTPVSTWTRVEPTCTVSGYRYKTCSKCGVEAVKETLAATGHDCDSYTQLFAPTCTQTGARKGTCTVCGEFEEVLPALGHDFPTTWTTVTPVSCGSEGLNERTCNRTGCGEKEHEILPQLTHQKEWVVDLPASCYADGSRHEECTLCHTVFATEIVGKLDHSIGKTWIVATAPTASTKGSSKQVCTSCGETLNTSTNSLDGDAIVVDQLSAKQSLSAYTIVYANSCKQNTKLWSYINNNFKTAYANAAGRTPSIKAESSAADNTSKQILIGITSRKESRSALSALQGRGFTIRIDGNRIVILGTDDLLTLSALQYFVNNYLTGANKSIEIPEDMTAAGLPVVALSSAYGSSFAYVYDADWDIDPYHMYVGDSWNNQGYPGDGREYPAYVFEYFMTRISQMSGVPVKSFTTVSDTNTTYKNSYEVLFATIDREESRAFRTKLDANQYGFYIVGNKIVLGAHIDAALEPLVAKFLEFYAYVLEYNGGVLPQGYEEVYTLQAGSVKGPIIGTYTVPDWKLNFPRPAHTVLEMAENNNNDAIQMIYTGEGASVAGFLAYCAQLEAEGFALLTDNAKYDNVGGTNNYFRLYKHTAKKTALYVAFDAFTYQDLYADRYASESAQFGDFIHSSQVNSGQPITNYPMRTYKQCIRIVSSSISNSYFPDTDLLTQQPYTKVCDSSITTIRYICSSVGMGYILQLEDGRFVIVDGGNYVNSCTKHPNDHQDREVLYHTLVGLYKKSHGGAEPTASDPIHIAAWLVTHSHADHYANMNAFLKKYVAEKLVKMDYLVGNYPELSTVYSVTSGSDNINMGTTYIPAMQKYFKDAGLTPFKFVKVHTGMNLYFANLKMEILMTTEDHAPFRITNSNDTNTVTKWTISSTANETNSLVTSSTVSASKKTTWTMLGDSCIYASRWLCAMWGGNTYNTSTGLYDNAYMAADMVQLAHHGNIGCEIALYKTVQAKVVWFAHNSGAYNSYTQDSDRSWTDTVDRYAVRECPTVQYIVVAGLESGTNVTNSVTISFNQNGIDFPTSGNPAWGVKCTFSGTTLTNVNYNVSIPYNTPNSRDNITYCRTSPVIKKK